TLARLPDVFGLPGLLDERDAQGAAPGPGREADFERVVRPERIVLPVGCAVNGPAPAGRGRALFHPADGEGLDALTIESDFDPVLVRESLHILVVVGLQPNLDDVLAVEGEVV